MWEQIKPENINEGEKYHFKDVKEFVHIGELQEGKIINSKTKDVIRNVVKVWK